MPMRVSLVTVLVASLLLATATATCGPGMTGSPCTPCAANTFKETAASAAVCTVCPTHSETGGATQSTTQSACRCVPGRSGADGGGVCSLCDVGKYKSALGSAQCEACTNNVPHSGTNSLTGRAASTGCVCDEGYTGPDGGACISCARGKFKTAIGSALCSVCDAGKFKAEPAQISDTCDTCPVNSNSPSASEEISSCRCNAGSSGPDGGSCPLCPQGHFKTSGGNAACTHCAAGKKQSAVGSTANCVDCAAGKYQNQQGQPYCLGCPAGTKHNGNIGQTSSDVCVACADGHYTYSGMTTCLVCPAGQAGTNGSCAQCAPGQFQDNTGASACQKCPAGSYLPRTGSAINHCTVCWPGKNALEGWGACCGAGEILANAGDSQCIACAPGQHQSDMAKQACVGCDAGKVAPALGASVCDDCASGKYKTETAATACDDCAAGKYLNATGSSTSAVCVGCAVGMFSNTTGNTVSTDCIACSAGHHADLAASAACSVCPRGKHSSVHNSQNCEPGFSSVTSVSATASLADSVSAIANVSCLLTETQSVLSTVQVTEFVFEVKLEQPVPTAGKETDINVTYSKVASTDKTDLNASSVHITDLRVDGLKPGADYHVSLRLSKFVGTKMTGALSPDKMLQGDLGFSSPILLMVPSSVDVQGSSLVLIITLTALWACVVTVQIYLNKFDRPCKIANQRKEYVFDKLSVCRSLLALICLIVTYVYAARFTSSESQLSSSDVAAFVYCGLAVPGFEVLVRALLFGLKKAPLSEHKYRTLPAFTRYEVQNGAAVFSLVCSWGQFVALCFLPTLPWYGTALGEAEVWNGTTVPNIVLFQLPSWYGVVFSMVCCVLFFVLYLLAENGSSSRISQLRSVAMPILSMALFLPIVVGLFGVFDCSYHNGRPYVCAGWDGLYCWLSTGHWAEVFVVSVVLMAYTLMSIPCQFQYQSTDIEKHGLELYQAPDFCICMSSTKYIMGISTWFAHYTVAYSVILLLCNIVFGTLILSRQFCDWSTWPTQSQRLNVTIRVGMWISFFCSVCAVVSAGINDADRPDAWIALAVLMVCVVPIECILMPLMRQQGEAWNMKNTGLPAALEKEYRACLRELPRLKDELQVQQESDKKYEIVVWEINDKNMSMTSNHQHDIAEWREAEKELVENEQAHDVECNRLSEEHKATKDKMKEDLENAKEAHDIEQADRLKNELMKLTLLLPTPPVKPTKPSDPILLKLPSKPSGTADNVWETLSFKCSTLVKKIDNQIGVLLKEDKMSTARRAESSKSQIEYIMKQCQPDESELSRSNSMITSGGDLPRSPSSRRPSMNPTARSPSIRGVMSMNANDARKQMVQDAKDRFAEYDKDQSGEIDQTELVKLLTDMGLDPNAQTDMGLTSESYNFEKFIEIYAVLSSRV